VAEINKKNWQGFIGITGRVSSEYQFGYARVSTNEESLENQIDSLKIAGCAEIFSEKISCRNKEKTQLDILLSKLRKNDILIVDSLDRLGRTSKELICLLSHFDEAGIQFRSIKE
ncbi:MAG: recombinase family protein, partial [Salinivirgaceae bacterium]|nr:recombinase family protein [Salinivirgaceae bacterium]